MEESRILPFCLTISLLITIKSAEVEASSCKNYQDSHFFKLSDEQANQSNRSAFHFQTPRNWINDPNGPMYYKGIYHLFYQYNPNGPVFGDIMIWAHSISHDLINWVQIEHALCPSESYDINSCWSGSTTILPCGKPVILYTGIDSKNRQVQNLAQPSDPSDPFLREWVKSPKNPLIVPPEGIEPDCFRDPTTAWQGHDGKWRILVGGRNNGTRGMALLYTSDDFVNWTQFQEPLFDSEVTGMWECPDFYPVYVNSTNGVDTSVINPSVRHVLKAGYTEHDFYVIGTYSPDTEKFVADSDFSGTSSDLRYDYGKFYASKTFYDNVKNRRILWGWVNESDSREDDIAKGWSGLQAIPRQIWLDETGKKLIQLPIEEIRSLRTDQVSLYNQKLKGGSVLEIQGISASQSDVEVAFEISDLEDAEFLDATRVDPQRLCSNWNASVSGSLGPFGLLALATEDLSEQTAIFFRIFRGPDGFSILMCSDHSRSSIRNNIDKTTYGAFVDIDPRSKISLRCLIDHSIIESFSGEGRSVITSRVYPGLAVGDKSHIYVFNNGTKSVTVSSLEAWSLKKAEINSRNNGEKLCSSEMES